MPDSSYDSDEAFSTWQRLEAVHPRLSPDEDKPPFLRMASPSPPGTDSPSGDEQPSHRPSSTRCSSHRQKPSPQSDQVLLSHLAPNYPDIAQNIPSFASPISDAAFLKSKEAMTAPKNELPGLAKAANAAQAALKMISDGPLAHSIAVANNEARDARSLLELNGNHAEERNPKLSLKTLTEDSTPSYVVAKLSVPIGLADSGHLDNAVQDEVVKEEEAEISTLPRLRKYTISNGDISDTLPALHNSPSTATSGQSPELSQSLPSLHLTVGQALAESPLKDQNVRLAGASPNSYSTASTSPTLSRGPSGPSQFFPTQILNNTSQMSPASSRDSSGASPTAPSHPGYWRAAPKNEPMYNTPSSSDGTQPPANQIGSPMVPYPTPPDGNGLSVDVERVSLMGSMSQQNGPLSSSGFRCDYPGCNAGSFQTQYLLK